jgi:hypothetical protein
MNMQPLRDAIKQKYGVSDEVSNQVIKALAEVERNRQIASGSQVQGFRARQPGDPRGTKEVPDIGTIIGQSTGTMNRRSTTGSAGSSGLIGMIISIVMSLLGMFLGNRQSQGSGSSGAVTSILSDILGGAQHPSQAPDLGSILGGLLGGSGSMGSTSGQGVDINDIMNSMLNDQSPSPQLTRPRAR